jgi:hypothetical protein
MNLPPAKHGLGVGALLLLLLLLCWGAGLRAAKPVRLEVLFLAVVEDPTHRPPERPTVLNGITGLSAIFAITNGSQDASVWFDTCAIEQKIQGEWQWTEVPPYESRVSQKRGAGGTPWSGIASADVNHVYPPGTCWNYVVAWPPGVPTNASWRLQLRYWRRASPTAMKLDDKLGVNLFARRGRGQTILTPEVSQ